MSGAAAVLVAVAFVWLGMVLAISFLEAPLKFRAPDVTLRIGLGIGRLVFRALNAVEAVFAVAVVICAAVDLPPAGASGPLGVAVIMLGAQVAFVRPALTRRSNAVLTGGDAPRSRAHYWYVALELVKVIALLAGGIAALIA